MLAVRSSAASQQELVYNSGINSTMTNNILLGIYTMVYFQTMYLYWTRKSSSAQLRLGIISTITAIYVLFVVQSAIAWYRLDMTFKMHIQSSGSVSPFYGAGWYHLLANACFSVQAELADALMIWRCYHVWNRSFKAIAAALFLLIVQIGIFVATLIILPLHHLSPPLAVASIVNKLISASGFITLFSTLLTTLLISYRIHSMTVHEDGTIMSNTRFKHVVNILVQSAAAYSFVLVIYAAASVAGVRDATVFSFQFYMTCFCSFAAGIAPTVMIARLATHNNRRSMTAVPIHFTGIRFDNPSTNTESVEVRSEVCREVQGALGGEKGLEKEGSIIVLGRNCT
ncbi:hypothetical protein CPC08DRAFT_706086 [Agrocybe pediades]|nr:hypothetical protein CPC08DRAFT_706086 [Agrocybe pediades]